LVKTNDHAGHITTTTDSPEQLSCTFLAIPTTTYLLAIKFKL